MRNPVLLAGFAALAVLSGCSSTQTAGTTPNATAAREGVCPSSPFDINYAKGAGFVIPDGYKCFDTTATAAFAEDPDQIVLVLSGNGRRIYVGVRRTGTGKPEAVARRELLDLYRLQEERATIERIYYGQYDGFVLITPPADAATVDEIMSGFIVTGAKLVWRGA